MVLAYAQLHASTSSPTFKTSSVVPPDDRLLHRRFDLREGRRSQYLAVFCDETSPELFLEYKAEIGLNFEIAFSARSREA